MAAGEFERRDLLVIIRSFRGLPPDLAERIAESLIHDANAHGDIAGKDAQSEAIPVRSARKKTPAKKVSTGVDEPIHGKHQEKLPTSSSQLELFAEI